MSLVLKEYIKESKTCIALLIESDSSVSSAQAPKAKSKVVKVRVSFFKLET
jgi:hypothetical protein